MGGGVFPLNEGELGGWSVGASGYNRIFVFFKVAEHGTRTQHHARRHAGHAGNFNAEGVRGAALGEGAQEDHLAVDFLDANVAVGDARQAVGQLVEFVVVGCEQHEGLKRMVVEVFGDGLGDAEAVVGGGSAPNFVE